MKPSLAKKLCCPFDKQDLGLKVFAQDTDENILEGMLTCSDCKRYYPIVYGLPIMSPDEYRELNLEKPLLERWQSQIQDSYTDGFRLLSQQSESGG